MTVSRTSTATAEAAPKQIYLTVRQGPSGATLIVSPRKPIAGNYIPKTREEWNTFRLFMFHVLHGKHDYVGLEFGRKISPCNDTTMHILTFLYADIARLVAPNLSELEQLENTAVVLFSAKPANTLVNYDTAGLWLIAHSTDYKRNGLQNAAFGAELDTVKDILAKTRPENRSALLSTPESANYPETEIHLDTAFKVALATGDEEMAGEIAQYLDPAEKARQFKNVFGPDFAAFLKQQEQEAESLFEGLEAAFNSATQTEVRNALDHVSNADGTTSALQQKIAEFKTKLEDYVAKTRPLHNDFILAKAYEIYDKNWSPWTGDQLCLFSQPVIGLIQETYLETSKKRSMDIAEGIYNRAQNIDKDLPARRSLLLAGSTADIRSVVDLGSRCCIDIFGAGRAGAWVGARLGVPRLLQKLCRAKTSCLENLCSHRNHINDAVAR